MTSNIRDELNRRQRIADMMGTAHSILRDRYSDRAMILDLATFTTSAVLVATTFIDPSVVIAVGGDPDRIRIVGGILSIAVFVLATAGLLLDWKQRATRHQHAVKVLVDVKLKCRELVGGNEDRLAAEGLEFLRGAAFAMSELPPIPDSQFAVLKAKHKVKVELSTMLDSYPAAYVSVLRGRLRLRDTLAALRREQTRRTTGNPE